MGGGGPAGHNGGPRQPKSSIPGLTRDSTSVPAATAPAGEAGAATLPLARSGAARFRWLVAGQSRRLDSQRRAWFSGERAVELVARADAQLGEDLVEVVLDGAGADEQPGSNLGVGEAVAGEPRDLGLLGGEVLASLDAAFAGALAGR